MSAYEKDHERINKLYKFLKDVMKVQVKNTQNWTYELPTILQEVRTAWKENHRVSKRQESLTDDNLLESKQHLHRYLDPSGEDYKDRTKVDISSCSEELETRRTEVRTKKNANCRLEIFGEATCGVPVFGVLVRHSTT